MQPETPAVTGKRYQFSIWRRLMVLPLGLVFFALFFSLVQTRAGGVLLLLAIVLAIVVLFSVALSYAITLHPDHLRVETYLKAKEVPWNTVVGYSSGWQGDASYRLHTDNGSVQLNAEVDDFVVVNEYLRQHLPQLWNDHHQKTFVFNRFMGLAYLLMLAFLGMIAYFIVRNGLSSTAGDGLSSGLILAFLGIVAAVLVLPVVRSYRSLTLSGRSLYLQPLFGEQRHYSVEDVESISLQVLPYGFGSRRRGKEYVVWLTLKNAQRIRLVYLEQGAAVLVNVLRNWWQAHQQPARRERR